jgi:hypothetical protein
MAAPLVGFDRNKGQFSASPLKRVPVMRVFGNDPDGVSVCAHIHQVFTVLLCESFLNKVAVSVFLSPIQRKLGRWLHFCFSAPISNKTADTFISRVGASINDAYRKAERANTKEKIDDIVLAIRLCKGIFFYGYHNQYDLFLKIYVRVLF